MVHPVTGRRWAAVVRAALLLALLLWSLLACGLAEQDGVERVPDTSVLPPPATARPPAGWQDLSVYFVAGSRLEAVTRPTADGRPQVAVDQLLAGPSSREVLAGLRTALSPQDLLVLAGPDGSGTAAVAVSREFTGITGGNQLLAVAQVVWTVTQFPEFDRVCFLLDGDVVQVPTDQGLTDGPVDRDDYGSIAPAQAEPAPTASTGPATPTGPTGPPG